MTKQNDETKIAIISTNIDFIKKDIAEIKESFKELNNIFVTKQYFDEVVKTIDADLMRYGNAGIFWKWISPTASAIIGSILTFLIIDKINK